jgi:hypothetical protein
VFVLRSPQPRRPVTQISHRWTDQHCRSTTNWDMSWPASRRRGVLRAVALEDREPARPQRGVNIYEAGPEISEKAKPHTTYFLFRLKTPDTKTPHTCLSQPHGGYCLHRGSGFYKRSQRKSRDLLVRRPPVPSAVPTHWRHSRRLSQVHAFWQDPKSGDKSIGA